MPDDDSDHRYSHVPLIRADDWGDFPVFRETFLEDMEEAEAQAFRAVGEVIYHALLETFGPRRPYSPIHRTIDYFRAVLADLRHLQGFLGFAIHWEAELERGDEPAKQLGRLCRFGDRLRKRIGALADSLEEQIAAFEREAGPRKEE